MRKILPLLCVLLCSVFCIQSAEAQLAGTYTIDPAQPLGGTNFQTFNQAVTALNAGITAPVVINVAPGTGPYNERIRLDHKVKTTATNTLTFNCNGVTLTFLSKEGQQRAGVMLDSIDYVTFDSLEVVPQGAASDEYGYGFHLLRDADHNTIRKCKVINQHNLYEAQRNDNIIINGSELFGVDAGISSCDSNLITQNYLSGGYTGITLSSIPYTYDIPTMMKGNQITNNTITDMDNAGVFLYGYAEGTLIDGNDITAPTTMVARGIMLLGENESTFITNNRVHNLKSIYNVTLMAIVVGSNARPGKENIVANNLIYDIVTDDEQTGIAVRMGAPASYVKIYNNTILLDDQSPSAYNNTYGIFIEYNSSNIDVRNNIVSITRKTPAECYALFQETAVVGLVSDYNNFHVASSSAMINAIASVEWNPFTTLADWQAYAGADIHSTAYDPLFVDAANGNLKPGEGAMDNRGVFVNVPKDIAGVVRNATVPDMGAYEFDGPPCTMPVAGTAFATPATTTCEAQPVSLSLTGNSNGVGQTYQWMSDADMNGSFATTVSTVQAGASYDLHPVTTLYYRAAVSCGSTTLYSTPVQVIVDPALAAGRYTIDAAKPAGGDNFQTFNDAILAMQCGVRGHVVFDVAAGTYTQPINIPHITGTSPLKTITFKGNGATINYVSANSDERAVIKLNGADYITIDSFNIVVPGAAADKYGFGIQLINNADHNTIQHCHITLNKTSTLENYAGIVISPLANEAVYEFSPGDCDSNTISHNTITGGYYGIAVTSADFADFTSGTNITYNKLIDNHATAIHIAATNSTLIEGNEISRPTRTVSYVIFKGIFANTGNKNLRISRNIIHNLCDGNPALTTQLNGIALTYAYGTVSQPNIISNNLLYNFNGKGLQHGLYYLNSDYSKFYHNTVSLQDSTLYTTDSTDATRGFAVFGSSTNGLSFRNNNITIGRTGRSIKHCIYMTPVATPYVSDNNNFFVAAGANNYVGHIGTGTSGNYKTMDNWRMASSKDANSINVDPGYKDPEYFDFTPTNIPFDNKGIAVGIDRDLFNVARNANTPDIGAIEAFMCTVFPVVQVEIDSQTVCTGAPVTFKVKNPSANNTYTFYDAIVQGNAIHTGAAYTVDKLNAPVDYWIGAVSNEGCPSSIRAHVEAVNLAPIAQAPVVTADSVSVNFLRFSWKAVPGAVAYQVSRDGINFEAPSSGANGLSHVFKNLNASDSISIVVRALGKIDCQQTVSARVGGRALSNQYFIPNTFTPNGNGQNDVFKIYSNTVKSIHLTIFNQWGEKVFETTNQQIGWDGTFRGKQQPSGVYLYVAKLFLLDGTAATQKGTINLVR